MRLTKFLKFCFFFVLTYFVYLYFNTTTVLTTKVSYVKGKKIREILFWTGGWSSRTSPVNGWDVDETTLQNCPMKCNFTSDKNRLDFSDAIIYHGVNWWLDNTFGLPPLPSRRPNYEQIWTWLRLEPPTNSPHSFSSFDNMFNWTVTYRWDSDVQYSYGGFEEIDGYQNADLLELIPSEESLRNKSIIAWMNSNPDCRTQSKREILTAELKKFVHIDIFGKCSDFESRLECGDLDCYELLSKKYKFWLSFENALCTDYVTEKLFKSLKFGMVPIVHAHKSVTLLLPRGSYIDVNNFYTIRDLADHLKDLNRNLKEYLKYFDWKKVYRVHRNDSKFWCNFCTKLHNVQYSNKKSYPSIDKWFYYNNTDTFQCQDPVLPYF